MELVNFNMNSSFEIYFNKQITVYMLLECKLKGPKIHYSFTIFSEFTMDSFRDGIEFFCKCETKKTSKYHL